MTVFYNDTDAGAVAWLGRLMQRGLIPEGKVDGRSIADIGAVEIMDHSRVHLFAGVAGWELALQLAGWPSDRPVWTGSCPCQPFSCAGKGKGEADERHLWPEMRRLIRECRPATIFGEQVASKAGRLWLSRVRLDLEEMGYAVGAADLCSAGVGAPNIRQRLYWAAESKHGGCEGRNEEGARAKATMPSQGRGFDRLAGAESLRRGQGNAHHGGGIEQAGAIYRPANGGDADGMARAGGAGLEGWEEQPTREELAAAKRSCGVGGVAKSDRPECPPCNPFGIRDETRPERTAQPSSLGFWSDPRVIECRDGKTRRIPIEPALFPLAPRLSGNVALLRGIGNAINVRIAAEFIGAYLETGMGRASK